MSSPESSSPIELEMELLDANGGPKVPHDSCGKHEHEKKHTSHFGSGLHIPLICDLMQGNVRSPFLLFSTFAFLIGAALLFFVMLFITATPVTRTVAFVRIPPSTVRFGEPLDEFSVLVRYEGGGVVPDAEVTLDLTPAQPLNLVLHARSHDVPARRVDCQLSELEGLTSYHHGDVDDMLCNVVPYNAKAVANSNGVAVFRNVTLAFGSPATYDLTVYYTYGKKIAHVSTTIDIAFNVISLEVDKMTLYRFNYGDKMEINATAKFVWPLDAPLPHVPLIAAAISLPMNGLPPTVFDYVASHYAEEEATLLANATDSAVPQCALGICNIKFRLRPVILSSFTPEMSIAVFFFGSLVTACESFETAQYTTVVTPVVFLSGASLSVKVQPPEKVIEGKPFSFSVTAMMSNDTAKPLVGGMVFLVAERVVEYKYAHDTLNKYLLTNRSEKIDQNGEARFRDIIFSSSGSVGKYIIHAYFGQNSLAMRPMEVESRVAEPKVKPHFDIFLQPYKLNTTIGRIMTMLVRDEESLPIPGKQLFMLPEVVGAPIANLEVVSSVSDNMGIVRILALRMRWRNDEDVLTYRYKLIVDGLFFGNASIRVNEVSEYSVGPFKGCHIFSPVLEDPYDTVDRVPIFLSNDITISINSKDPSEELTNTIRCCVNGGETQSLASAGSLCYDGLAADDYVTVSFSLPIYRFNYSFAEMVCFDSNCRDITATRLPFVYTPPITSAAFDSEDSSAITFSYVGLGPTALKKGTFTYRYAVFLNSMAGYDYAVEKTACTFPQAGKMLCVHPKQKKSALYAILSYEGIPFGDTWYWLGMERSFVSDNLTLAVTRFNANGEDGNITATVEIRDADGELYTDSANVFANWARNDNDAALIFDGTMQNCWNNRSVLETGPCLVRIARNKFVQPQVTTKTGVASFQLRELSGTSVPMYIIFCIGANPPVCIDEPIPDTVTWDPCGGGCFSEYDAEVMSFPSATGFETPMAFSVDSAVDLWDHGFPSYPRCWSVERGIEIACNYRDTIPDVIIFEYVHSYLTAAKSSTETEMSVVFPASAPQGAYRIVLVIPGYLYEVGTVFVGQSSCVLAPQGDITAPPSLMVGEPLRMSVHVQCGNTPAVGAVVVATVDTDTSDCEATECGVLQTAGARSPTNVNGTASFYLVPTAIMPNQTMWISFHVPIFDPLRAAVEASHELGNSTSALDEELMDRAERLFALATSRVRSREPYLRIGPIRIANDVLAVEIVAQPEMKCTLEKEEGAASSESEGSEKEEECVFKRFPSVRVLGANRTALANKLVSVLLYSTMDTWNAVKKKTLDCEHCSTGVFTDANGIAKFADTKLLSPDPGEYYLRFFCQGVGSMPTESVVVESEEDEQIEAAQEHSETAAYLLILALLPILWANTPHTHVVSLILAFVIVAVFVCTSPVVINAIPIVKRTPLLLLQVILLYVVAALAAVILAVLTFFKIAGMRGCAWARCVDDEARIVRSYRYVYYLLHARAKPRHEAFVEETEEEEGKFRKKLARTLTGGLQKKVEDTPLEQLGENIAEIIEGEGEPLDPATYEAKIEPPPAELQPNLPTRLVIVIAFTSSLTVLAVYASLYILNAAATFMSIVVAYVESLPELTEADNKRFREAIRGGIEFVITVFPSSGGLAVLRQAYPLIDRVNLTQLLNWISRIANAVNERLMLFGIISIIAGVLAVVLTIILVIRATKVLQVQFRKGKMRGEETELEDADEYLGLHCVNIMLTFFFGMLVCGSLLTLGAYVYYHFTAIVKDNLALLAAIGVLGGAEILIGKSLALLVTAGMHVSTPGLYLIWALFGGVLSIFEAIPATLLRLIKYLVSFGFLFARFDLNVIPTTSVIEDKAHIGYMSLLAVDHTYNNGIVLSFVAFLLAKKEVSALSAPRPLSAMGSSCRFPNLKNMVRTVLAVQEGVVSPRPVSEASGMQCVTDFFLPKLDQPISLDNVCVPAPPKTSASHELAAKRWHLWVMLVRNPSLCCHRKHRLLRAEEGETEEHEEEHHSSNGHREKHGDPPKKAEGQPKHGQQKKMDEQPSTPKMDEQPTAPKMEEQPNEPTEKAEGQPKHGQQKKMDEQPSTPKMEDQPAAPKKMEEQPSEPPKQMDEQPNGHQKKVEGVASTVEIEADSI